ncbi:UDP-N-acetylenolpyruvoylglucosamine reductase [Labilibaculum filiforme]|uniref:UDP-N-acetylenolpyruvoylglucosamine reductase n=1 Tax=Labilibaculum filiforme TaxID=1940526 RepID=A0A2N3HSS1_9BACT|nr:UDP-N-acetylmuramate dehydrogenase [Labilibaculum filiforme]PKQ61104.1 UDP-N-acetylenolpyruvoylglucosamine reductase [Labilibaculum filiforme]
MAVLRKNYSLKDYNTFGIEANAKYFFEFETNEEIHDFLSKNNIINIQYLLLGGGSNLLFTEDFNGLVIHPKVQGIKISEEEEDSVLVRVGANENWDDFVGWSVENNLSGIENLSSIPGVVGAAPVQNIGAYGVEVREVIESVEAISIESNKKVVFSNAHCEFDYRHSVFKKEYKNQFIITHVNFRFKKQTDFKIHYGTIAKELEAYAEVNSKNIREVIIRIRESKLPDPKVLGNAGSFFKNPVVTKTVALALKAKHENMPIYELNEMQSKLASGWLIEQCGWKGKKIGDAGVHKDQALVIVNYGNAKGHEILELANEIKKSVLYKFGIKLEMEVNAI